MIDKLKIDISPLNETTLRVDSPLTAKWFFRKVPSARWNKDHWRIPITHANLWAFLETNEFEVTWKEDTKEQCMEVFTKIRDQYAATFNQPKDDWEQPLNFEKLSEVQKLGAHWLTKGSCILGDEPGSGKTVQALVALNKLEPRISIVVCPKAVMKSWEDHIYKWTRAVPMVIDGPIAHRRKLFEVVRKALRLETDDLYRPIVIIMGWQMLRMHTKLAGFGSVRLSTEEKKKKELNDFDFGIIIADEAHRAKNPKAKQTRALWALKGDLRWAMTGTPLANSPSDFWSLLRFIEPKDWPSRMKFVDRYCDIEEDFFARQTITGFRPDRRDEFDGLVFYRFLRRSMAEAIGRDIVKQRSRRYATLSPKHRRAYTEMRENLISELDGGLLRAPNSLSAVIRLIQLSGAMLEMTTTGAQMVKPSPKAKVLAETVQDLGVDIPIVVMSASKQLLKLCAEEVGKLTTKFAVITGETPQKVRDIYIDHFNEGKINILMATIGCFSEGVDLSKAKHMIVVQRPWSQVDSTQAEDRIRRWTQESDVVEIIDIITEDTIDARILQVLNNKKQHLAELTYEEIRDLL